MRSGVLFVASSILHVGCSVDYPVAHSTPSAEESAYDTWDHPVAAGDGVPLFLKCLVAMGGKEGFAAMKSGYIELAVYMPVVEAVPPELEVKTMLLSIHFDESGRDRRRVRSTDGDFDSLFVSDGQRVWIQPKDEKGFFVPANAAASEMGGPMLISVLQTFPDALSRVIRMEVGIADQTCPTCDVIDVFEQEQRTDRFFLNRDTNLPERLEREISHSPIVDELSGKMTTTVFSDYQSFGPAVIPTRVKGFQGDQVLFEIEVRDANFVTEPDDEMFAFPVAQ